MLALGPCVMAMHVARLPLKMQAYPSSAVRSSAVRVQPPSCVEAYMESPSEDYYQTSGRPLDDIQPLRSDYFMVRPARRRLWLRGLRPVVLLVVVLLERLAQLGAHLTRRGPCLPKGLWSRPSAGYRLARPARGSGARAPHVHARSPRRRTARARVTAGAWEVEGSRAARVSSRTAHGFTVHGFTSTATDRQTDS